MRICIFFLILINISTALVVNLHTLQYIELTNHQDAFNTFCNTQFQDYPLSSEDKDFLNGWTLEKLLKRLPNRNNYQTYIAACMDSDTCLGLLVLKMQPLIKDDPNTEYFYDVINPHNKDYDYALIECSFVRPEWRRKGIASKLIDLACKKCKDLNIKRIARIGKSYNTATINLYNKLGFNQINPQEKMLFVNHQKTTDMINNMELIMFEKILI